MFRIRNGILYSCSGNEKKVVVPDTVRVIGERAFAHSSAEEVLLPEGLSEIREEAFFKCEALGEIRLPSSVYSIGRAAFRQSGLTRITLPGKVRTVSPFCFERCEKLESVMFGTGTKAIGKRAFAGCEALKEVIFPDTLETIGHGAFSIDASIHALSFPLSLKKIDSRAFFRCINLETVSFPERKIVLKPESFRQSFLIRNVILSEKAAELIGYNSIAFELLTGVGIATFLEGHISCPAYADIIRRYLTEKVTSRIVLHKCIRQNSPEYVEKILAMQTEPIPFEDYLEMFHAAEDMPEIQTILINDRCRRYPGEVC